MRSSTNQICQLNRDPYLNHLVPLALKSTDTQKDENFHCRFFALCSAPFLAEIVAPKQRTATYCYPVVPNILMDDPSLRG